jgi:hypothetical protein
MKEIKATKIDEHTITLNVDTKENDLLILRYEEVGSVILPP